MASAAASSSTTTATAAPKQSSGFDDVTQAIKKENAVCLNQTSQNSIKHFLLNTCDGKAPNQVNENYYVESKTDEQLLIHLPFAGPVHIRSLRFFSEDSDKCPEKIKLYVNRPNLDFDDVASVPATQELEITREYASDKNQKPTELKFVKFRNVTNLTIFVESNHGAATSVVRGVKLYGQILETTEMKNLKKIGNNEDY